VFTASCTSSCHSRVPNMYACSEVIASTRNVQRSTSASIQGCDRFQNLPRLKCFVRFHISHQQTTAEGFPPQQCAHCGAVCPPELSDLTELVEATDDKLFQLTLKDNHNILSIVFYYRNLTIIITCACKKHHNRQLLPKNTHFFIAIYCSVTL